MTGMDALSNWTRRDVTLPGFEGLDETRQVWSRSPASAPGPGVIVIHEFPGISASLISFADQVVERGFTVWLPRLFGEPLAGGSIGNVAGDLWQFCVRREFSVFARGKTSPVAHWLRSLARELDASTPGDGVGVVGMCFTGGFALAMVADAPVIAPVLAEPSLPAPLGRRRAADVGLDATDLRAVQSSGCEVLALRYSSDVATGTRFDTLSTALGPKFFAVEFEGKGHSVLTGTPQPVGTAAVLDFLDDKLAGTPGADRWRDAVGSHRDGRPVQV